MVVAGLGPLWSLSVEEYFYLLWAPLVRYVRPLALLFVLSTLAVGGPVIRLCAHVSHSMWEYYWFFARVDTLAYGSIAAVLLYRRIAFPAGRFLSISGALLALVVCATNLADRETLLFSTLGYSVLGATCACSVLFVVGKAGSSALVFRFLRNPLLQQIGKTSFVIYLLHTSIRACVAKILVMSGLSGLSLKAIGTVCAFLLTVALAGASWKYFESPILALKDRLFPQPAVASVPTPCG